MTINSVLLLIAIILFILWALAVTLPFSAFAWGMVFFATSFFPFPPRKA